MDGSISDFPFWPLLTAKNLGQKVLHLFDPEKLRNHNELLDHTTTPDSATRTTTRRSTRGAVPSTNDEHGVLALSGSFGRGLLCGLPTSETVRLGVVHIINPRASREPRDCPAAR